MERIENPRFEYASDVASALDRWAAAEQRARDEEWELTRELAPTGEESEIRQRLLRRWAEEAGIDESLVRRVHELQSSKLDLARRRLDVRIRPKFEYPPIVLDPPEPVSHDFWWAHTDWFHTRDFSSSFRDDGLAFFGGPNGTPSSNWLGDTDLLHAHFGAVAWFEIKPERLPSSPLGRWLSEPSVDISGRVLARTTSGSFPNGDSWSKCWLHLDHQVFQWGFGPDGPVPIVLGQRHEVVQLVDEEDDERTLPRQMNGFTPIPGFMFSGILPAQSLWARIEVRFDVQIEGAGSFLWCDPEVRLVTHQWPLRVIS
jgi:hypothetical protein